MEFTPPGCESFSDALNKIHALRNCRKKGYHKNMWGAALGDRGLALSREEAKEMRATIAELQKQLFTGERTACYLGGNDLEDLRGLDFGRDGAETKIALGKVANSVGNQWNIFLRPAGYVASSEAEAAAKEPAAKDLGGRPVKKSDAALVYWTLYPLGHRSKNLQWQQALDSVNRALTRAGRRTVSKSTLDGAIKEYPSND